jgi:hypothetical protein
LEPDIRSHTCCDESGVCFADIGKHFKGSRGRDTARRLRYLMRYAARFFPA